MPLWGAWQLHGDLTHTSISEAYTTLANNITVFDYQQFDALVRLADTAAKWPQLSVGATNLLDERGITQNTMTGPANDVSYVRPRAVMVRLDGRF
jgi:outer membrane receptor protein involved in Fe transport